MTPNPLPGPFLAALAAAALSLGALLGCGSDDDSSGDPVAASGAETTEAADAPTPDAEEGSAAEELLLTYRVVGSGAAPGELGLEIDAQGRGSYAIGQGREIEFELGPDELAGLRRTFDRIGFADLPERIEPEAGEGAAGAAEVEVGHEGKVVREVPGSPNSPLGPIHAAVAQLISKHAIKAGRLSPAAPGPSPGE